ncbi:YbaK/EbsC family protein [Paraburkholderia sp. C35]|uniref:YbaK/EbsC family protein n=1 Tax=Paraburkholderia sp. C35 TaxID=2126993 RepID=UPI000D698A74|nr:YbaK/EbsC family protein [Paraburkholderia sp. C35]
MLTPDYLSRLDLLPEAERFVRLPNRVAHSLDGQDVMVFNVPDDASDTDACRARFGIPVEDNANTIILRFRKDGAEHLAAVVALAGKRIDVNGAARRTLAASRISFASRDEAVDASGMEYGGITAFGVPVDWPILVDTAVLERQTIVMGAGIREAKLLLAPSVLLTLSNVSVVAVAKPNI